MIIDGPPNLATELAATLLQGAITAGLAGLWRASLHPLSATVVRVVCHRVDRLRCALAMHLAVSAHQPESMVVLASGDDGLDRIGTAVGGHRLSATTARPSRISAGCALPTAVVVHRHLHDGQFSARRWPAVLFMSLATLWTGWCSGGTTDSLVQQARVFWPLHRIVGTASPRLQLPACAGRVDAVGLLPRHFVRTTGWRRAGAVGVDDLGRGCARVSHCQAICIGVTAAGLMPLLPRDAAGDAAAERRAPREQWAGSCAVG